MRLRTYLLMQPDEFKLGLHWQEKTIKNGVRVSGTQVNESTWQSVKGEVTIKCEKEDLIALVRDDHRTTEYDDMFDKFEFIHQLDEETSVRLIQVSKPS